jgi:hypothetical protein
MSPEARRDVIESIGLAAIVASLIFLAVETRQNTAALYAESRQSVLAASHSELFMIVDNPDLMLNVASGESLNAEQQVKLGAWLAASMRSREFSWLQYRDGIIDEAQWQAEVLIIRFILDADRTREWWQTVGQYNSHPEFVEFIQQEVFVEPATGESWKIEVNWAQD